MYASYELAVEASCRLLDAGKDVFSIDTGWLKDSIGRGRIARIYTMWIRAKPSLSPDWR
jgi:hypothetical protein